MPTVDFAQSIRSHVEVACCKVPGGTVRESLDAVMALHPRLRNYLLDDRGALRKHVSVVINGEPTHDRQGLSEAVAEDAEIFVMQALSGG